MACAATTGLSVIALTDHDTTDGWGPAADALPVGLSLVRGAEISCRYGDISLHLLAYLFDPSHPALSEQLAALVASRSNRAQAMVQLLADAGLPVTWEQVRGIAGGTVGRPHIAQALIAHGLVSSIDEAFTPSWIGTGGRYWVGKLELDVFEALSLVKAAGGVTVFAHPAAASRGRVVPLRAIGELADAGLDGLEVDHPDHDPGQRRQMSSLAADLGLLATGSSDFHGSNKSLELGAFTTQPEVCAALVSRATGCAVLSQG